VDVPARQHQTVFHRLLRWLAILGLAYGLLRAVTLLLFAITQGFPFAGVARGGRHDVLISWVYVTAVVLLVVGSAGLLWWKRWSRRTLLVWAPLQMSAGLVSTLSYLWQYTGAMAGTTQPTADHVLLNVWTMASHWLEGCLLPILFLWALLQPEAAKLWAAERRGGFEVVPMADVAPSETSRVGGAP
jgi:hypothetical protein